MSFKALLVSALLGSCAAFSLSPARPAQRRAAPSVVRMASATDTKAILKRTLERTVEVGLLTKLANTGLLRKASNAGVKFADLEPLLKLADDQGLLYVLDAVSEDALPLLPTLVETAPAVLPLAAGALSIPAPLYFLLALGCPLGAPPNMQRLSPPPLYVSFSGDCRPKSVCTPTFAPSPLLRFQTYMTNLFWLPLNRHSS